MTTATRARAIALQRTERHLTEIGDGFLEKRTSLNLSQDHVAASARMDRLRYGRIERGDLPATLPELNAIAAVLGLELSVRLYPGGTPVRDAGQATKLGRFLEHARAPLWFKVEVGLPMREGAFEHRAWDAVLFGHGERTACELEMRLRDVQAMRRRHDLKRRDDPTEHFLLLIADTRANRRAVAEFATLLRDLPRLRPSDVYRALEAGRHPPTGLVFV